MTSAWFLGATGGVPQDETAVRSTVETIRTDPEFAEDVAPPDFNEFETDESSQLVGLSPRMVAGDYTGSEKRPPINGEVLGMNHNALVDNQVSTSGTAAARERAGEQGHGTMPYAVSLTPELRDGATFGNEYFNAMSAPIQEGAGQYLDVVTTDHWANAVSQAFANQGARDAAQSSMFNAFLETSV